jgi:hypothetical protein
MYNFSVHVVWFESNVVYRIKTNYFVRDLMFCQIYVYFWDVTPCRIANSCGGCSVPSKRRSQFSSRLGEKPQTTWIFKLFKIATEGLRNIFIEKGNFGYSNKCSALRIKYFPAKVEYYVSVRKCILLHITYYFLFYFDHILYIIYVPNFNVYLRQELVSFRILKCFAKLLEKDLCMLFFICNSLGGLRNVLGWKRKNKFYFYP